MNMQTVLHRLTVKPRVSAGVVVLALILATGQVWALAAAQESDDAVSPPEGIQEPDGPANPAPRFEGPPQGERNGERRPGPPRPPAFEDIDTNNDSVITPEEFNQFRGRDGDGQRRGSADRPEARGRQFRDHSNPRPVPPSDGYRQDRPERSFERGDRDNQRIAGPPPRGGEFDERRPPRGEFNENRPPRRDLNNARPPRGDVSRQRSARQQREPYDRGDRGYDNRPPKSDAPPRDSQGRQEGRPTPPRFQDLDTDADGSISQDEFEAHHKERQRNRPPRGNE